jgi:hypothetical protein
MALPNGKWRGTKGWTCSVCGYLFLATLWGCTDRKPTAPSRAEFASREVLVLDQSRPEASIDVSADRTMANAVGFQIPVLDVTNASLKPVQVFVFLEGHIDGKSERTQLGHFALFPPNQPGNFSISLTAARRRIRAGVKPRLIVLKLASLSQGASLEGVRLRIGPLLWMSKE